MLATQDPRAGRSGAVEMHGIVCTRARGRPSQTTTVTWPMMCEGALRPMTLTYSCTSLSCISLPKPDSSFSHAKTGVHPRRFVPTIEFRPHRHHVSSKKSSFVPVCPSGISLQQPINMLESDNLAATNNFLHIASKTRSRIPLQTPRRSWSLPRRPAFCCGGLAPEV